MSTEPTKFAPDDYDIFKALVSWQCFPSIKGKKLSLVTGLMGDGKSMLIAVQVGADFDSENEIISTPKGVDVPVISSNKVSQSLSPSIYGRSGEELLDSAGVNEDRGLLILQWTRFSLAATFSLVDRIDSIVVVIDAHRIFSRGDNFRALATQIATLAGKRIQASTLFYDSLVFVITKAYHNGKPVQASKVMKEIFQIMKTDEEARIAILKKYVPTTAKFLEQWSSTPEDVPECDVLHAKVWNKVTPADKESFNQRTASVRLADAFVRSNWNLVPQDDRKEYEKLCRKARSSGKLSDPIKTTESKCVISFPHGKAKCEEQRRAVRAMIQQNIAEGRSLERSQLDLIVKSRDTNFRDVVGLIVHTAMSYNGMLVRMHDTLVEVAKRADETREERLAIQSNWSAYRDQMIKRNEEKIAQAEERIRGYQNEIGKLSTSDVLDELDYVTVQEDRVSLWNSWVILGGGVATGNAHYSGDFDDYSISSSIGNYKETKSEFSRASAGSKGCKQNLRLSFESHLGYDLNLIVIIKMKRRNHPKTFNLICDYKNRIKDEEEIVAKAKSYSDRLFAVKSAKELQEVLLDRADKVKKMIMDCNNELVEVTAKRAANIDLELPTNHAVIGCLYQLISTLVARGILNLQIETITVRSSRALPSTSYLTSVDLNDGPSRDAILEFKKLCELILPLQKRMREEGMGDFAGLVAEPITGDHFQGRAEAMKVGKDAVDELKDVIIQNGTAIIATTFENSRLEPLHFAAIFGTALLIAQMYLRFGGTLLGSINVFIAIALMAMFVLSRVEKVYQSLIEAVAHEVAMNRRAFDRLELDLRRHSDNLADGGRALTQVINEVNESISTFRNATQRKMDMPAERSSFWFDAAVFLAKLAMKIFLKS
jgi:hypothetical protein